jgi:hypothetical protein
MIKNNLKFFALIVLSILMVTDSCAQGIERVTFSSTASSNDNFQPIMGAPYGANLLGANGSLEISASYNESVFEETTLFTEELKFQSSVRVFPNPTTCMVNIDLNQLPQGEYELSIIDNSGKTVYRNSLRSTLFQLDLSAYPVGTYVLKVQLKGSNMTVSNRILRIK